MDLPRLLAIARGDEPADLVLRGARIVHVTSGEVERTALAVAGDRIAGLGPDYGGREEIDLDGRFVAPGWIDAHVHVESAMVPPSEFARIVVPRGVTTVVADPHEIANVLGEDGVEFMLRDARAGPLRVCFNAPSCVPATDLATAGACLGAEDLARLGQREGVLGLAEVMAYPAVVGGNTAVLDKIRAFGGRPVDGHCPGLGGTALNAYVAAGIGSDHESVAVEEAREKLRRGLTIFLREGSAARNLRALLPLVDRSTEHRTCFCTDDRHVTDLLDEGSIDHLVRRAIELGLDPITALRMATIHVASHYGLSDRGALVPGRLADLVVFSDLDAPRAERVWVGGRLAATDGELVDPAAGGVAPPRGGMRVDWSRVDLGVPARGSRMRVIEAVADQITTRARVEEARVEQGLAVADVGRDLLKIAVVERHRGSGRVGRGFVRGIGLRRGAIAGTVAHDHHNLVLIGADDASMEAAGRAVTGAGGGLAVARDGRVEALLALPIAGLMTDRPFRELDAELRRLLGIARDLGSPLRDPFMTMSFLCLEVIPELKLSDRGLVDVAAMRHVPLFVEERT